MAREVNIYTTNWRATGQNVNVPQYAVDVTINATNNDGTKITRSETLKFPNFLQNVGAADLKEWITELMIREARERLGIDS